MTYPILNFKCPQCGRRHVRPFDKATGTFNSSQKVFGTSIGASAINHTRMWTCDDCGYQFRDVNDWHEINEKGIANLFSPLNIALYAGLSFFVWTIIILIIGFSMDPYSSLLDGLFYVYIIGLVACTAGLLYVEKNRLFKEQEEIEKLAAKVDAGPDIPDQEVAPAPAPACATAPVYGAASAPTYGAALAPAAPADNEDYKYCSNCGNKIKKTASFCDRCGHPTN